MDKVFMPAPDDNSYIAQEYRKRVAELDLIDKKVDAIGKDLKLTINEWENYRRRVDLANLGRHWDELNAKLANQNKIILKLKETLLWSIPYLKNVTIEKNLEFYTPIDKVSEAVKELGKLEGDFNGR